MSRQCQLLSLAGAALLLGFMLFLFDMRAISELESEELSMFLPFTNADLSCLSRGIELSREYQMKLFSQNFTRREHDVAEFLVSLSHLLGIPSLEHPGNETIRFQTIYNTQVCGKRYNPRVRNYFTGFRAGTSSLDIKSGTDGHEGPSRIVKKMYRPSEQYSNNTEIKFEWDIHPCKVKYSLESRIFLKNHLVLYTCGDVADMFPRVAERVIEEKREEKIERDDTYTTWIHEMEHHGKLYDGKTYFKSSITLQYNNKEEALSGITQPSSPEWSLRIWSTDHGKNKWIRKTVQVVNQQYQQILHFFGTPDYPCSGIFPAINTLLEL